MLTYFLPETVASDPLDLRVELGPVLQRRVHHEADPAAHQLLLRSVLTGHVLNLQPHVIKFSCLGVQYIMSVYNEN